MAARIRRLAVLVGGTWVAATAAYPVSNDAAEQLAAAGADIPGLSAPDKARSQAATDAGPAPGETPPGRGSGAT
jgi:hypothetical protein